MKRAVHVMLLALFTLLTFRSSFAQVGITVSFGPPALPVYEQPLCPGEEYLWTPGYWAYDPYYGYYWVPGTWVLVPERRLLWTPGWWGWSGAGFIFHEGYWAPRIGFYGGINYGYGYSGRGFEGGRWQGDHFFYNRAASNVNVVNIHNTYNTTIINNVTVNRVSYNGGEDGITARPTPQEQAVEQQRHISPIAAQVQHVQTARSNPALRASANQGRPPIAAVDRPGALTGQNVVAAKEAGAPYHSPPTSVSGRPVSANTRQPESRNTSPYSGDATHASDLQPHQAHASDRSADVEMDSTYEERQSKLAAKQKMEHKQLEQEQEREHQLASKQHLSQDEQQKMEQRHQQQTQQMENQHTEEQQNLKTKQKSPAAK